MRDLIKEAANRVLLAREAYMAARDIYDSATEGATVGDILSGQFEDHMKQKNRTAGIVMTPGS